MSNLVARSRPRKKRTTREEMKQQSREALLDAALELFAEQGIDVPSLDAICDRAGYTRGAFYIHFADREELLVAVMERVGAEYLGSVFQGLTGGDPPRRGSSRFLHAAERFISSVRDGRYPLMSASPKGPLVRMNQLLQACARSEQVKDRYKQLVVTSMAWVADLVAEDQREKGLRADLDAQSVGALSLAIIIGAQTMTELGIALDPAMLVDTVETMLSSRGGGASR
jgi:TetR/AcrR family transcriptional repressor of nem operon